jgi:DNA repair protein RadC
MPIPNWPAHERPREKLLAQGAATLSDAELLAIFLRTGARGKSAVDLGRNLLHEFGSLRYIVEADYERFCQGYGLGAAKYTQLQAALEIAKRYLHETLKRTPALHNPKNTHDYLTAHLRNHEHEVFACLFLDSAHHVIRFDKLFYGTINHATVHPREIVKRALLCNAAAVILAHNHPSGIAEPSQADKQITRCIQKALQLVDVKVLDHMIIGDGHVTSFAERGLL